MQENQTTQRAAAETAAYPAWLAEQQARLAVVSLGPLLCLVVLHAAVRWCARRRIFRGQQRLRQTKPKLH